MGPRLGSRGKPRRIVRSLPRSLASMGPRLGSRGKGSADFRYMRRAEASMGPRLGSRGKVGSSSEYRQVICSGFNGAATWKSRKDGEREVPSELHKLLQWGRDLEVAESLALNANFANVNPRFNGAATWKSRKASIPVTSIVCQLASMGPRLGSRGKRAGGGRGIGQRMGLQWGRDLEVAERQIWESVYNRVLDASMGPRLGSRGKPRTRSTSLRTWLASMGPRLGSRGKTATLERLEGPFGRFNGAATWKSRKATLVQIEGSTVLAASMGPRLGSRGKKRAIQRNDSKP